MPTGWPRRWWPRLLEPRVEPIFHPDIPTATVRAARPWTRWARDRRRCWKQDWVIDLDIRDFFDSVPHDLFVKAVDAHTDERWVLLYVKPVAHSADADARRDPGSTGPGYPAGVPDDSSNAVGNFCFEVSLSYRRVELPRRVSAAV